MTIRAETDTRFILRFLVIGLVLLGFGLYCLYDGFIQYPHDLQRAKAFYRPGSKQLGEPTWVPVPADSWESVANENGWKLDEPKKPDVIEANILWNYGMAVMSFLVGLPILFHWFRSRNGWIEANDEQLSNHRGQTVSYESIQRIDKAKWEKKGIAHVEYEIAGKSDVFVIDDLKFQRLPADQLMQWVESKIDPELVVGPLEPVASDDDDPVAADG